MTLKYLIRYSLALVFFALGNNLFAQDTPEKPSSGTLTEVIEVERPYKPVLAEAVKVRRSPNLSDIKPYKAQLTYNITDKKQELNTDIHQLQAQQPLQTPAEVLKNNYLKIGAGNLNGGLAEIYMNTGSDEALQAGFFFKHLAQEGDLNKQKFASEKAGLFGKSILDNVTLNGELGYDRLSTYFYGLANPLANSTPQKQNIDLITLKGEIAKNYRENDGFDYNLKGDTYFYKNALSSKEVSAAFSGFVGKTLNQFNAGINASVDFTANKDAAYSLSNNIARINPHVKFSGSNYKVDLGVRFIQEFGASPRTNLLPDVSAEAEIVPHFATIYAGFTGDVLKTSVRELSENNPYLNDNLSIKNAVEKVHIYGGIKGNASSGFAYKATGFYRTVTNLPLFVNSKNETDKFDIIYDGGNATIAGVEGEIGLTSPGVFVWTGKLKIDNYKLATEESAWFKPDFQLQSNLRLSVNKKFTIDGNVILNGETEAKTYAGTPAVASITSLKSFADLSGGAEYNFTNKIGLYIHVNNILGTKYQQYLYYSKLGLNVIGGFNFSF